MRKRDRIFVCGDTGIFEKKGQDCPNYENHEPMPTGYVEFSVWGEKMNKTHKNVKCSGCGLYQIWELRKVSARPQGGENE
jgi:hypothetical protein